MREVFGVLGGLSVVVALYADEAPYRILFDALTVKETELSEREPEYNTVFYSEVHDRIRLLKKALKLEESQSQKAIELYREVLSWEGEEMYRVNPRLLIPVDDFALERLLLLAKATPDYSARGMVEEATKLVVTGREEVVLRRYPTSALVERALYRLGSKELELGNPFDALHYFRKLGILGELRRVDYCMLAAKVAVALAMGGKEALARRLASAIPRIDIASKGVSITDLINSVPAERRRVSAEWLTLGGDSTHNFTPSGSVSATRMRWVHKTGSSAEGGSVRSIRPSYLRFLNFPYPVVTVDKIALGYGRELVVLDRSTGAELYRRPSNGLPHMWSNVLVSDGKLLYWLPGYYRPPFLGMIRLGPLVAVELRTGKVRWQYEGAYGLPAVEDGRLYGVVLKQKPGTELYAVALSARSGQEIWKTFLTTTVSRTAWVVPTGGLVAVGHGRVFVATGQGVLCALRARTGELVWSVLYDRTPNRGYRTFSHHPIMLLEGWLLVIAPGDSNYIYGIDAETGRTLWRLQKTPGTYPIALKGRTLYTGGNALARFDVSSEPRRLWHYTIGDGAGMAVLCGENLYQPLESGLLVVDSTTGKKIRYIKWVEFDKGYELVGIKPSFVTVAGRSVVFSGRQGLALYTRQDAIAQLLQKLKVGENSTSLYRELGLAYEEAGRVEEALEAYRKARRLGVDVRERIYVCLTRLSKKSYGERRLKFLEEALRTAPDLPSELEASLQLAMESSDPARTLQLCQRVIQKGTEEQRKLAIQLVDELIKKYGRVIYEPYEEHARRLGETLTVEAYERLYRLYPNSISAQKLLYRLTKESMKRGETSKAVSLLIRFVRQHRRSPLEVAVLRDLLRVSRRSGLSSLAVASAQRLKSLGVKPEVDLRELLSKKRERVEWRKLREARFVEFQPGLSSSSIPGEAFRENWTLDALNIEGSLMVIAGWSLFRYELEGDRIWVSGPAWMGVSLSHPSVFTGEGVLRGAWVGQVYPGTPAERALLRGRDIIVEFDGKKVWDVSHLIRLCASTQPGREVDITVLRAGRKFVAKCRLGLRPIEADYGHAYLLGSKNGVVALQGNGYVNGIDVEKGEKVWARLYEPQRGDVVYGRVLPQEVRMEGGLLVYRPSSEDIVVMEASTAETLCRKQFRRTLIEPPIITPFGVLLLTRGDELHLLDILTGERKGWKKGVKLLVANASAYASDGSSIYALSLPGLKVLWSAEFPSADKLFLGEGFVAGVSRNTYIILSRDGKVISRDGRKLAESVEILDAEAPIVVSKEGERVVIERPGRWKRTLEIQQPVLKSWSKYIACMGLLDRDMVMLQVLRNDGEIVGEGLITLQRLSGTPFRILRNRGQLRVLSPARRPALAIGPDGVFVVGEAGFFKMEAIKEKD